MVFICPQEYSNEDLYKSYFEYFPFELSNWQKWSLQAMVEGNHSLVTAPTGSGKTLPAEFSIKYFHSIGKKIIYTSPIKALSNQKYHEFTSKYPDISFGILTGDIKDNPEADVLIMTTEILRNNLYQKKYDTKNLALDFNIDIESEVGVVIFDEVHYINDQDRGTVWEECFMLMPPSVQLLMLSATIDKPEKFAKWIEDIHETSTKKVYLSTTSIRFVPLEHYLWLSANSAIIKNIRDKEFKDEFIKNKNKLHLLKSQDKPLDDLTYHKINKYITYIKKNNIFIKRQHVLHDLTLYLKSNDLIPAIYFVYSRANVEKYAYDLDVSLFEDDSTIPQTIDKECRKILQKLPNFEEYMRLPEYINMIKLFQRGIGIHHSGIMPILREMVEILFEKKYIKLLIATETFAVGLNMPTKTVVFTNLSKFDGSGMRYLQAHEYTQQAGRAGRRGYDTKGIVIHLSNLFEYPYLNDYKTILGGIPQTLVSKFKISYNLLLNLYFTNNMNFNDFANNSMITNDISKSIKTIENDIEELDKQIIAKKGYLKLLRTPVEIIHKYFELESSKQQLSANKRKKVEREINNMIDCNKNLKEDIKKYTEIDELETKRSNTHSRLESAGNYINHSISKIENILHQTGFIEINDEQKLILEKGKVAAHIKEIHCLVFANLLEKYNYFEDLEYYEIAAIFSCFTNVSVLEDYRDFTPKTNNMLLKNIIIDAKNDMDNFMSHETNCGVFTGSDYNIIYDLIDYVIRWCNNATDEASCKEILQVILQEKNIFLGEFIKAILKINNIASECEKLCEYLGNMELLSKIKQIPLNTLKFVATNQSLYV